MSASERVKLVVPGDFPQQIQGSPHLERLEPYGDVTLYTSRPADAQEKLDRARDADVIINTRGAVTWPGDDLRSLPRLRMIATCSVGTDMIDVATATELDIVVSNQPGRTAKHVAEHIFGLMLAGAKRGRLSDGRAEGRPVDQGGQYIPAGEDPRGDRHRQHRGRGGPPVHGLGDGGDSLDFQSLGPSGPQSWEYATWSWTSC